MGQQQVIGFGGKAFCLGASETEVRSIAKEPGGQSGDDRQDQGGRKLDGTLTQLTRATDLRLRMLPF